MQQEESILSVTTGVTSGLHIYLLGPLRIEDNGVAIHLPRRKVASLLAYLLLHPEPQARDQLARRFWRDSASAQAAHSLRTALVTLRKALAPDLLITDRHSIQFNPNFACWVDLRELLALEGEIDALAGPHLLAKLALWQGDLLADLPDGWVTLARKQVHTHLSALALRVVQRLRTRSEYTQAIAIAQRLLTFEPTNEDAHQHSMFCYMAIGDRAAALHQYEVCERLLAEERQTPPLTATTALYHWIKEQDGGVSAPAASITNLPIPLTSFVGRTRETAAVKRLLKAPPDRHQPALSVVRLLTLTGAGGSGKTRLAIQVATDLIDHFADGVWWVDLTGLQEEMLVLPTVAKTLGIKAPDPQKLLQALANFLSHKELLLVIDNCEHLLAACRQLVAELLMHAPHLQILTTSREPLHIAGERCWQVPTLALPDDAMRQSLQGQADGITGDPAIKLLLQSESIRLFVERAVAVQPGFQLTPANAQAVIEICERLDGIPLAVEMAAARVRVLSVEQIAAYLTSALGARFQLLTQSPSAAPPRQQTLHATIAWSCDLLDEIECDLFRQTTVFQGGFTFAALTAIAKLPAGHTPASRQSADRTPPNLLDLLTQLIDKSLIIAEPVGGQQRYRLLETVREYAWGCFPASAERAAVQQRHADYFLAWAEAVAPALQGMEQRLWFERLSEDYGNLHAALAWFEQTQQIEAGLRLGTALEKFWRLRGYHQEGQRWLEMFLGCAPETRTPTVIINAQHGLALLYISQSNSRTAQTLLEQGLALARQVDYGAGIEAVNARLGLVYWELGDHVSAAAALDEAIQRCRTTQHLAALAEALNNRSLLCWTLGELVAAIDCCKETLAIARQLGDVTLIAVGLFNLGLFTSKQGDFVNARRLYEESIALYRQLGDEAHVADVLINLGLLAVEVGEFALATTQLQEAAQIHKKFGDEADVAYSLKGLADIAFFSADYGEAQALYQDALLRFRAVGNKRMIDRVLAGLGWLACRQGDFVTAARHCAEALTLAQSIGHKAGLLFCLEEGYAELAVAVGQPAVAARLLAVADGLHKTMSFTHIPSTADRLTQLTTKIAAQLGEAAFAKAWAEGQSLDLDQAVAYTLDTFSPATLTEPPPRLRIFAFGPARIFCGERLLTAADWTYDKARELVFFLISQPHATREAIGLHFWPDASTEQVRKRFSAALSHARNALGRATAWITLTDGRYSLQRTYWYDVEQFEARLDAARHLLLDGGANEQAVTLLAEAVNLYQGDFVEDFVEGEWQQSRRTSLRQRFLDALVTLGRLHTAAQRDDDAIAAYQRALAKDPYLEEAQVALIRCFARLGKRSQALHQVETLTTVLADLGVTPAPETQALIQRLRRGEPL